MLSNELRNDKQIVSNRKNILIGFKLLSGKVPMNYLKTFVEDLKIVSFFFSNSFSIMLADAIPSQKHWQKQNKKE